MSETFVGLHSALCCGGFCNGSVSLIPQSPEFWPGGFVDPIGPWRTFRSTTKQQDFTEHLQRISLWFLAVLSFHSDASQPHIWMETPQPGTAWTGESVQSSDLRTRNNGGFCQVVEPWTCCTPWTAGGVRIQASTAAVQHVF